jgi:hypothetical protein
LVIRLTIFAVKALTRSPTEGERKLFTIPASLAPPKAALTGLFSHRIPSVSADAHHSLVLSRFKV